MRACKETIRGFCGNGQTRLSVEQRTIVASLCDRLCSVLIKHQALRREYVELLGMMDEAGLGTDDRGLDSGPGRYDRLLNAISSGLDVSASSLRGGCGDAPPSAPPTSLPPPSINLPEHPLLHRGSLQNRVRYAILPLTSSSPGTAVACMEVTKNPKPWTLHPR